MTAMYYCVSADFLHFQLTNLVCLRTALMSLPQRCVSVADAYRRAAQRSVALFVVAAVAATAAVCRHSRAASATDTAEASQRHATLCPDRLSIACGRGLRADGVETAGADSVAPVAEVRTVDVCRQLPQS